MELVSSRPQNSLSYVYINLFIWFLCSFLSFKVVALEANNEIKLEPAPKWVELRSLPSVENMPLDEIQEGEFYRLIDNQIQVTDIGYRTIYSRYAVAVINQTGIDSNSQVNIKFDPSYQKIVLNTLIVWRDGQRIDKLKTAKVSLFNAEDKLDEQTYNGSLTVNVLVDDIREGDTVDYSYTRYGANPIYKGIFSYSRNLNWAIPVYDQYLRILWGKPQPLLVKSRNIEPIIEREKLGNFTEYQIHMHEADFIRGPSETPNWYSPYSKVYFSELENWGEVVSWAKTLYNIDATHSAVVNIANDIKLKYSDSPAQIVAALKYVQDNIRYVGLQMGINSHLPTPAHETLALRYGDCKDKAILLISILNALGIDAYPALVDTEQTKLLNERPPAHNVFDHVIVTLTHDNQRFWLDPTLRFQEGSLTNIFQPDFGYALILKNDQSSLTSMAQEKHNSYTHVSELFVIPEDINKPVTFTVITNYLGDKARQKFGQLERDGKQEVAKDYEVYYQSTYPSLTSIAEIDFTTDTQTGVLTLTEQYSIDNFWTKKENDFEAEYYPTDIRDAVFKPKQINRNAPLSVKFPNNIINTFQVKFEEDGWNFEDSEFIEDNDYFYFKKHLTFKDNTLTTVYEYKAKTDYVPADKIDTYLAARTKMREKAYNGLLKYGKNLDEEEKVESEALDSYTFGILIISLVYLLGLLVIIISWRQESKKRPVFTVVNFYPVSMLKFLVLSIATMEMYTLYWMYRNWKFIQQKQDKNIMPIIRGIFAFIWFYPLFNKLKEDSLERFNKNTVMPIFFAVVAATIYFVISVIGSMDVHAAVVVASTLLPCLFIPFVNYINSVNTQSLDAYNYNSKWSIRNTIAVILCLPLLGLTLVSETPLLPSNEVVTQADIMKIDMNFLHRKKIIPPNEKIIFFYSDAFLTIRDDGNGFTNNRVFSYWLDENNKFNTQTVTFEEVKDIKAEFGENTLDNTIVTITKTDDSEFMLFISPENGGDKTFVEKLTEIWKSNILR